jgi:opacity protein-like surface antigen
MRSDLVGGEVDFGYGPSFFGTSTLFGKNAVATLMGNVIVGIPMGTRNDTGIRPYVTAGLGVLHSQVKGGTLSYPAPSDDGLGWNAGAGVMGYFSGHIGLRGDLRYLRGFKERDIGFSIGDSTPDRDSLTTLRLWRASFGVVFR